MASEEIELTQTPPLKRTAPAGSLILKEGEVKRELLVVESGELTALSERNGIEKILFSIGPGSLIGVTSLFEGEALPYSVQAKTDSILTVISEDDMYSHLRDLPVWLLATIKKISSTTKEAKLLGKHFLQDPLQSFSRYLVLRGDSLQNAETCITEYTWLSRVSPKEVHYLLHTLSTRKWITYSKEQNQIQVPSPLLLDTFADYLDFVKKGKPFPPFTLSNPEKKALRFLSQNIPQTFLEKSEWLKWIGSEVPEFTIENLIRLQSDEILISKPYSNFLEISETKLKRFLIALAQESDFKRFF